MRNTIGRTVDAYVMLRDRKALVELLEYRQGLILGLENNPHTTMGRAVREILSEIAIINAGLDRLSH